MFDERLGLLHLNKHQSEVNNSVSECCKNTSHKSTKSYSHCTNISLYTVLCLESCSAAACICPTPPPSVGHVVRSPVCGTALSRRRRRGAQHSRSHRSRAKVLGLHEIIEHSDKSQPLLSQYTMINTVKVTTLGPRFLTFNIEICCSAAQASLFLCLMVRILTM